MKKLLAIVTVVIMTFTMATVAFAKTTESVTVENKLYTYDSVNDTLEEVVGSDFMTGEDLYIRIDNATPESGTPSVSDLKNYRIRSKFTDGKRVITDVEFDSIKVDGNKQLVVKISVADTFSAKEIDVDGVVTIYTRGGATINDSDSFDVDVDGYMSYGEPETASDYHYVNSPVVNFDDCTDVELYFGDDIYFAVNAKHQDDLFLRYNSKIVDSIYEKYPDADLTFVGFDGNDKTFLRTGTLYIPYELDEKVPFIYERTADGLKLIKDAYDKGEEMFVIRTKTLGNYVISDIELKDTIKDESSSKPTEPNSGATNNPNTGAGNKPNPDTGVGNPDTGANDFVGVAVALAVVSAGAIGALTLSKSKKVSK